MATQALKNGAAATEGKTENPPSGGGKAPLGGMLPLVLNLVMMPVIAFLFAQFYLIPQIKSAKGGSGSEASASGHGESGGEGSHGGAKGKEGKGKFTIPLGGKILVNVAGTAGTRYLVANLALVSNSPDLKTLIEHNEAQLKDAASGVLAVKTIADLEKPGIRNQIRSELMSIFNDVFGKAVVSEIYLTEFAIQ